MQKIVTIGFWSGLLATSATLAYVIVQLMQINRLLPYPLDEITIYATSLCIVIPFVIEMLSFHYSVPFEKRFWTHGALIFTTVYAVFVTANYVVQLATVIPSRLQGEADEVRILEQTPHSIFWDFDALGYIFMGIAMLFTVPAFDKQGIQKFARLAFLANGLVTPLITIVYFYPNFSERLLLLGFPWALTAPLAMLMLAISFRKQKQLI